MHSSDRMGVALPKRNSLVGGDTTTKLTVDAVQDLYSIDESYNLAEEIAECTRWPDRAE